MKLLIVGAGSFSTEVEEMARLVGYDSIAFLDDNPEKAVSHPVLGTTKDIDKFKADYENAIVAIGNNEKRLELHNILERSGYVIPSLIHPTAFVSDDAVLAPGCIIRTFAVVGRYSEIGKAVVLNIGAKVDHHCIIGAGSHLLINSVVRNSKRVGELTWLNAANVIQ